MSNRPGLAATDSSGALRVKASRVVGLTLNIGSAVTFDYQLVQWQGLIIRRTVHLWGESMGIDLMKQGPSALRRTWRFKHLMSDTIQPRPCCRCGAAGQSLRTKEQFGKLTMPQPSLHGSPANLQSPVSSLLSPAWRAW